MSFRQSLATPLVCEDTTTMLRLELTDERDRELAKVQLSTLTLTLYVSSRGANFGAIINDWDDVDILGSCSDNGVIEHRLEVEDNVLMNQRRGFETHVALIRWTWAGGTRAGANETSFTVANQMKMGASS